MRTPEPSLLEMTRGWQPTPRDSPAGVLLAGQVLCLHRGRAQWGTGGQPAAPFILTKLFGKCDLVGCSQERRGEHCGPENRIPVLGVGCSLPNEETWHRQPGLVGWK